MTSVSNTHTVYQPIAIVLDVSPSMATANDPAFRAPIVDLNDALGCFVRDLSTITHCAVECMLITFAEDVVVECDFELASSLKFPNCSTRGSGTNLGGAIGRALDEVQARRDYLRQTGVEVNQPWLLTITDGQPNTNSCPGFDTRLAALIANRKCLFIPIAVGGCAAFPVLEQLCGAASKPVVVGSSGAGNLTFTELFSFLSQSIASGQVMNLADIQQSHE